MGMDIHMHIIEGEEFVDKDIYSGRNIGWFNNLRGQGNNEEYDHLHVVVGIPKVGPKEITDDYGNKDYFDFSYCTVGDFLDWYYKYRPDLDAGWITTYEKWKMERKNITPEFLLREMPSGIPAEDLHFIEVVDEFDCSKWLAEYLESHFYTRDMIIVFYFDW